MTSSALLALAAREVPVSPLTFFTVKALVLPALTTTIIWPSARPSVRTLLAAVMVQSTAGAAFSAVIEVVAAVADSRTADIISAFLEITTGCDRLCGKAPLYVTAFFIGFGGLSAHCQIFSALGKVRVNPGYFFLFRAVEGIIAMGSAYILLMITPMQTAVFSSSDAPMTAARPATYAGSGALILAALCFVGSVSGKLRRMKVCAE